MIVSPMAIVTPPPPAVPAPLPTASPVSIPHAALKMPLATAPCSPRCRLDKGDHSITSGHCGHSITSGHGGRSITPGHSPRLDSLMSTPPQPAAAAAATAMGAEEIATEPVPADTTQAQTGVFDMESDWPERLAGSSALDPAALAYASMGKPQPWTVRPMDLYDSLRAQIRAIDDDDNEFYPS
ncbi:hypothetical protein LPJ61_004801 [Coemansia biformis]|uniref:Uncharacterized protein n=1 Tax=Coemansia biformis TaxID=1286918 RepID=A0A9W8CUC4_9FUNG|nr:hypothetical protein LPJ61_004801 [Coemansia biformis]